jgi:hypothetical protein
VNGEFLCHTLELPWRDNKSYISAIPSKTYGANVRYDKKDHWRIELRKEDTAPRTGVQIHIANNPSQIEGCIVPGSEVINASAEIPGKLSGPAFDRLKTAFYGTADPIASPNKAISLDIIYNVAPTEFVVRDEEAKTDAIYKQDGISWRLYYGPNNGRHVWDEIRRTMQFIIFKGVEGAGFWKNRYVRLQLHGGGNMEISDDNKEWSIFGEGSKIIRRDGTSRV